VARLALGDGLPRSNDTRLLLAGVVAVLVLVVYLAVAFANTHASVFGTASNLSSKVAPWSPQASDFAAIPRGGGAFAVVVTPATKGAATGAYGAVAQTILPDPVPGGSYLVQLRLKGARPGRIAVELNEFRPGVARYPVQTSVPATRKWHDFKFRLRVKGRWLGLAMYVYRSDEQRPTWFALRGLEVALLRK
jgi:hypothetical protein